MCTPLTTLISLMYLQIFYWWLKMVASDRKWCCWSDIWAGDTLQRGCKSHSAEIIITWLGLIVWATNIVSQLAVRLDWTHFKSLLWCSVQMGSENCSNNQYEEIWALVECVKCFWCSPFLWLCPSDGWGQCRNI